VTRQSKSRLNRLDMGEDRVGVRGAIGRDECVPGGLESLPDLARDGIAPGYGIVR